MKYTGYIIRIVLTAIISTYICIGASAGNADSTGAGKGAGRSRVAGVRYGVAYNPFSAARYLTAEGVRNMIDRDVTQFSRLGLNFINIIMPDSISERLKGRIAKDETVSYMIEALNRRGIAYEITVSEKASGSVSGKASGSASEKASGSMSEKASDSESEKASDSVAGKAGGWHNGYVWYPFGKDAPFEYRGNLLPQVDTYNVNIMYDTNDKDNTKDTYINNLNKRGRINNINTRERSNSKNTGSYPYNTDPYNTAGGYYLVDAVTAGTLQTYLYPAMARTLRGKGFDAMVVGHYDPSPIAGYNIDTPDDYLNLLYTPGRALGLMIGAEAAAGVKSGAYYGEYPENMVFDEFTLYPAGDLAVYNTAEKYYHTNTTTIEPESVGTLHHIAGVGNSPIISYDGTGAYFLDKLPAYGLWRLEILPDAVTIRDPFGDRPDTSTATLYTKGVRGSQPHNITISDKLIAEEFVMLPINTDGNNTEGEEDANSGKRTTLINSANRKVTVTPGVYLLGPADNMALAAAALTDTTPIPGTNLVLGDRTEEGKTHLALPVLLAGSGEYDHILYGSGTMTLGNQSSTPAYSEHGGTKPYNTIPYNKEITPEGNLKISVLPQPATGYVEMQKYVGDIIARLPDIKKRRAIVVRFKELTKLTDSPLLQITDKSGHTFSEVMEIDTTKVTGKEARVYFDRMWSSPAFALPTAIPATPALANSGDGVPESSEIETIRLLFPVEAMKPMDVELIDITLE